MSRPVDLGDLVEKVPEVNILGYVTIETSDQVGDVVLGRQVGAGTHDVIIYSRWCQ